MRQEASRPDRIAKLIMPGGSAQVGSKIRNRFTLVRLWGEAAAGCPAHTHFEQMAALVNCFPEFIDLAGFKLYGFIAITCRLGNTTTQRQSWNGPKSESSDCTRGRPPGMGFDPRNCVRDL
jgi:hypothetical protein